MTGHPTTVARPGRRRQRKTPASHDRTPGAATPAGATNAKGDKR